GKIIEDPIGDGIGEHIMPFSLKMTCKQSSHPNIKSAVGARVCVGKRDYTAYREAEVGGERPGGIGCSRRSCLARNSSNERRRMVEIEIAQLMHSAGVDTVRHHHEAVSQIVFNTDGGLHAVRVQILRRAYEEVEPRRRDSGGR